MFDLKSVWRKAGEPRSVANVFRPLSDYHGARLPLLKLDSFYALTGMWPNAWLGTLPQHITVTGLFSAIGVYP